MFGYRIRTTPADFPVSLLEQEECVRKALKLLIAEYLNGAS
jgi:hypothetical protein